MVKAFFIISDWAALIQTKIIAARESSDYLVSCHSKSLGTEMPTAESYPVTEKFGLED